MKIDSHTIIYKAAQTKFNVTAGSIVEENNSFVLTSDDGRTFTEEDLTTTELLQAETEIQAELAQTESAAKAAREAAEAKLAALGLTTEDLKALGL